MAEIKNRKLLIDGYIYIESRRGSDKIYWDCPRMRSRECKAQTITNLPALGKDVVLKGPQESHHTQNRGEVQAVAL